MFAEKMIGLEDAGCFALSRIFRWKPRLARVIVEKLVDPCSIFGFTEEQLLSAMGPFSPYPSAITGTSLMEELAQLQRLGDCGFRWISYSNSCFPQSLKECDDGPMGLFVVSRNSLESLFRPDTVSVVGTRDISSYGEQWCRKTVACLAATRQKPTIVSGLAFGVDITAHLTALREGLPTIAVLGTGIDKIYPSRHETYARMIIDAPDSAIVSEYPPGTSVTPTNFLYRNRIIAGLAKATVLVESRLKGGGMATARQAAAYNREVFAVPGRNDDIRSQGCNYLIYSNIASALINPSVLTDAMGYSLISSGKDEDRYRSLSAAERKLFKMIRAKRGIAIEQLVQESGLAYKDVSSAVYRMEAEGLVDVDIMQRCSACK